MNDLSVRHEQFHFHDLSTTSVVVAVVVVVIVVIVAVVVGVGGVGVVAVVNIVVVVVAIASQFYSCVQKTLLLRIAFLWWNDFLPISRKLGFKELGLFTGPLGPQVTYLTPRPWLLKLYGSSLTHLS